MEWIAYGESLRSSVKKYKWVVFVIFIGILLMLFPGETKEEINSVPLSEATEVKQLNLQQELEEILSRLEGAGNVQVLLTESIGKQTIYQTDQNSRKTQESEEVLKETVILTQADRSGTGLIIRVDPPRYLGAVVLCQGADKPAVRLAIVDAVSTATGLRSDKISVWKMK